MLYLNEADVVKIGNPWIDLVNVVTSVSQAIREGTHAQPLKAYLRYGDAVNRIIAMPAYIPVPTPVSGIKWIASFPMNLDKGLPRAHSVTILNNAVTGQPTAIINTALISCLRTAAVSGALLSRVLAARGHPGDLQVAIIGFGPIGRAHYRLCNALFGTHIKRFLLHDRRALGNMSEFASDLSSGRLQITASWEEAIAGSDIVITCTSGTPRYIDVEPIPTGVYLNISLRDFFPKFLVNVSTIIVDDWDEVCREDTDVYHAFLHYGLKKANTLSLASTLLDLTANDRLKTSVIFNPMGLAVYDVAVGAFIVEYARLHGIGLDLPS